MTKGFPSLLLSLALLPPNAAAKQPPAAKSACVKDAASKVSAKRHALRGVEEENFKLVTGLEWMGEYWQKGFMEAGPEEFKAAYEQWCEALPQQRTQPLDPDAAADARRLAERMRFSSLDDAAQKEYDGVMSKNLGDSRLYAQLEKAYRDRFNDLWTQNIANGVVPGAADAKKMAEMGVAQADIQKRIATAEANRKDREARNEQYAQNAAERTKDVMAGARQIQPKQEELGSPQPHASQKVGKEDFDSYKDRKCAGKAAFDQACDQIKIKMAFRCQQICQELQERICVGTFVRGTACGDLVAEKNRIRESLAACVCK